MASTRKKAAVAGAAALAVAAGGVGVAQAVGGDSDQNATGPDAARAKAAGVQAAGGGKAIEAERSDEKAGGWEVKVQKPDSTLIEVQLNDDFSSRSVKTDDDSPKNPSPDDGETNDDG